MGHKPRLERATGTYLPRFAALAEQIAAHPSTVLLHFSAEPPITETALQEAMAAYGGPLSERWLAIYRECKGLELLWKHVDGEDFDAASDRPRAHMGWFDAWRDYGAGDGSFVLLPLEKALTHPTEGFLWFDSTPEDDVGRRAVPFDAADMYYIFAFIRDAADPDPRVVLGDDHGATFNGSARITMAEYLELVLACKAVVQRRAAYLGTWNQDITTLRQASVDLDRPDDWL